MYNTKNIKNFISDVLKQSGEIAKKHFNSSIEIKKKNDSSIVTIADKEIESFIRTKIKEKYPDTGILGEEFEDYNPEANEKFIIDPIDGTIAFTKGIPTFGIMICFMNGKNPDVSGIYQPITGEMWVSNGEQTDKNISNEGNIDKDRRDSLIIATTSYDFLSDEGSRIFKNLANSLGRTKLGGDCYNYCKLADGEIDIIYEEDLKYYDYLPLIPILKSKNAVISDSKGNLIKDFDSKIMKEFLVCRNEEIFKKAISLI